MFDRLKQLIGLRANIQNPSVPLSASNIAEYIGMSNLSTSGVNITRKSVLGYPAVIRAVNLISDAIATAPLHVFRQLPSGGKERDPEHPAYMLLRRKPGPFYTDFTFKKTMQSHALLHGSAYARIHREPETGNPYALEILDPEETYPLLVDGRLSYVTRIDGRELRLQPDSVLHVKGLGYEGITAYSLLDVLRDAFGLGLAAQRFGGRFYSNNTHLGVIIEVPYRFPNQEAVDDFRSRFGEIHQGIANAHRPVILENGAKVSHLTSNMKDAELIAALEHHVRQIANIFGLPPHILADPTRTSFASLEQENRSLLMWSLSPWIVNWEAELWDKILRDSEKERGSHTIKFETKAFMRADTTQRTAFYSFAVTHRVMTPNEIREMEDMNPIEGGDDMLPLPNESVTPEQTPDGEPPVEESAPPEENGRDAALAANRVTFLREAQILVRRLSHQASRAAKKPDTFLDWLDGGLESDNFGPIVEAVRGPTKVHQRLTMGSTQNTTIPLVTRYMERLRGDLLEISGQVTADKLEPAITQTMRREVDLAPEWLATNALEEVA